MAKANETPAIKSLKAQAARLGDYLATIDRKVTSQQALEAMARAVHGRPFNTVVAAAAHEAARHASAAPAKDTTFWYYDEEIKGMMPLTATFSLVGPVVTFGSTLTRYLDAARTEDLKQFLAPLDDSGSTAAHQGKPWFLEQYMQEESPFATPHTLDMVQALPTRYTMEGVLAYFKAFRPERYLELVQALLERSDMGAAAWLAECEVNEVLPEMPGRWLWVCRDPFETPNETFDSRVAAEVDLADTWLDSVRGLFTMQERMKFVRTGSGLRR